MKPTGGPTRSTSPLEVSIIRKISRQRRMFTRRNACRGSISSTVEFVSIGHVYEVRPRKDKRGVNLVSDVLRFGRLGHTEPDDAIEYAKPRSRSHHAVIRVYDAAGNVIKTHEHKARLPRTLSQACILQKKHRAKRFDKQFLIQNWPLFCPFGNRTAVRIRLQYGGRRIFFKRRRIPLGQDIFSPRQNNKQEGKSRLERKRWAYHCRG